VAYPATPCAVWKWSTLILIFFLYFKSLFVSRERWRPNATGALSTWRTDGSRHPETRPSNQHSRARGSRMCRDHQQPHQVRLHRRQRLCKGVGYQSTRVQVARISTRLFGTYNNIYKLIRGRILEGRMTW